MEIPSITEFLSPEWRRQNAKPKRKKCYSPDCEAPPHTKFYQMKRLDIDNKRAAILMEIDSTLINVNETDQQLIHIREEVRRLREISWQKEIVIAIVGFQGIGKSSLTNALLHRYGLALTSSAGTACTSFVTMFKFRPGSQDGKEISDVEIKYMNEGLQTHYLVRIIRDYKIFYFLRQDDDEDFSGEQERAETAREVFVLLFKPRKDEELASLLTLKNIDNGKLLCECLRIVAERIEDAGADQNGVKRTCDLDDEKLREERKAAERLWPFVENMTIYTASGLLQSGITLVDVPGFGDTNQTRTSVAYEMRRKADHEFIVASANRVATDSQVIRLLQESIKAHGPRNTTLIINKIDNGAEDTDISKEINSSTEEPFPTILERWCEAQELAEDEDKGITEESLNEYLAYLTRLGQNAFIAWREKTSAAMIHQKLNTNVPINIYSVSADKYNALLLKFGKHPWTPEQTRIPRLRQFARSLSSDMNHATYHDICFNKFPTTIARIGRVLGKYSDEDDYAQVRKSFGKLTTVLDDTMKTGMDNQLPGIVPCIWPRDVDKDCQLERMLQVIQEWGKMTHWMTFDKIMRDGGFALRSQNKYIQGMENRNLNFHLSQKMHLDLGKWKVQLEQNAAQLETVLVEIIKTTMDSVSVLFKQLTSDRLLQTSTIMAWEKEKIRIVAELGTVSQKSKDSICALHKYMTTETDSRTIVAKRMARHYLLASQVDRGKGVRDRQISSLIDGLSAKDPYKQGFIEKLEKAIMKRAKTEMQATFDDFTTNITTIFQDFSRVMEEFLETDSDTQDVPTRMEMEALYPKLQTMVEDLQTMFNGGKRVERDEKEADSGEHSPKKVKSE